MCLCLVSAFSFKAKCISARSCVVICGETGEVIYGENENFRMPMASTTKIMTGLLLCEYGNLDREIVTTKEMVTVEGSSMGLLEGDTVSLKALLYGLLLASGNDAANTIAIIVGGSVENFVNMMNERAEKLGLEDTHFETPSGLDGDTHYTTCYELSLIAREAMKNEEFAKAVSTESIRLAYGNPPYSRTITNHNRLLKTYDDVVGVKTGFTKKSGRCLVSAARRDGKFVIAVTLNAPDDWRDHRYLLDLGLEAVELVDIKPKSDKISIPVISGEDEYIESYISGRKLCVKRDSKVECKVNIKPYIIAPVKKGEVLGEVSYLVNDVKIFSDKIKSEKDIKCKKATKIQAFLDILKFTVSFL